MLLRESHLTFERIAHEWARELDDAKNPGRLNRDEILLNMIRGAWRVQFPNLTLERALRDDKDGRSYKPDPGPITREVLDKVVLVRQGARRRYPVASRWEFRTSLKLDDYEPLSLHAYLEPLTILKEDFGRWCDEQGHQRPRFWFGKQADAKKLRKGGRKKGAGSLAKKDAPLVEKMKGLLAEDGDISDWQAAGLFAREAEGGGTFESKQYRLHRRYKKSISVS